MSLLNSRFVVPVGSFLAAVALSWLGGPVTSILARQAGGATACTGSATATSITVAAGSGIKKGTAGWTFSILDQPITTTNSKQAGMVVADTLFIDAEDVVGIDTNHKKHPLGTLNLQVSYIPVIVYENQNIPAGGINVNAIPATISLEAIEANMKSTAVKLLPTYTIQKVTGNLNAQTTLTHQIISLVCQDGTVLPDLPRPDTKVPVDGKGNGKAVKN